MTGRWFLRGGGAAVSAFLTPLALAILPPSPAAMAEVPSAIMRVDSTRTTLGSPLELTLRLRHEPGDEPLVPDLTTLIDGAVVRLLSTSRPERAEAGGTQVGVEIRYDLRFYDLGHQRIPSIEVAFARSGEDTLVRTAGPLEVEVVAVREADDAELRDIKPPVPIPGGIPVWLAVVVAALALVGAAAGVSRFLNRRKGSGPTLSPPPPPVDYAVEFARIAAMGLLERGAFKIYYSLLSDTLRRFLEEKNIGVGAMERTTGEIAEAVGRLAVSPETVREIVEFLNAADLVKFARAEPALEVAREAPEVGKVIVGSVLRSIDDSR